MTQQDLVETICRQTGISKRDLARWIGTDHSVLCRYIAGTRSLPLKPLQQLLFLHQHLSDLPPQTDADEQPGIAAKEWQQQAEECSQKLQALKNRYQSVCSNSTAASKTLQLLNVLAIDTWMLTPKKERWIAEQRYQAEKLAADNNKAARQKLRLQIALLQKELEIYQGLIKGVSLFADM